MVRPLAFLPLLPLLLPEDAESFTLPRGPAVHRHYHHEHRALPTRRQPSVSQQPPATPSSAAVSPSLARTRLHVFDPQQIVDTASSLLADVDLYSDTVLSSAGGVVSDASLASSSSAISTVLADASLSADPGAAADAAAAAATASPPEMGGISYSKASYYTVLGLYLLSFPGLWSTIKRSTTAKVKNKTFVARGEASPGGKGLREQAGEIMAYMKANNYEVVEAGETITFRGIVPRSLSQAFFLTFCTALGMLSLALVLQIQFVDLELPAIGKPNWFLLAFLSPYAGLYYWKAGDRVDTCQVKLSTNEAETENEILVQGSEEELERMWRTMEWQEKGMVKVEGLLDKMQTQA